ncbi:MAG: hypothetical protein ACYC26_01375 [Phycisphaerales bacterium]
MGTTSQNKKAEVRMTIPRKSRAIAVEFITTGLLNLLPGLAK